MIDERRLRLLRPLLQQAPGSEATGSVAWTDITGKPSVFPPDVSGLTKSSVGLANVDNTADAAKNVLTATKLATARNISLSGDGTWSVSFDGSGSISSGLTLATVNSNTGTFGGVATVPQFSVDGKGRITSVTAVGIEAPWAGISGKPAAVSALSGTNTGDQNLAPYALLAGAAFTGDITTASSKKAGIGGATSTYMLTVHGNASGVPLAKFVGAGGLSQANPAFDIIDGAVEMILGPNEGGLNAFFGTYSAHDVKIVRGNSVVATFGSAGLTLPGTIAASNLSGTNTGDQDLSGYATTAALAAGYQPLDTQLTALAGLSYAGNAGKSVKVNGAENGFELGTAAAGAPTLTQVEVSLGTEPRVSGKFTITSSGLVTGKPVYIQQAVGPYTGKGTLADEAEMDQLALSAAVVSATAIDVYWNSRYRVAGNFKFNYMVGA